MGILKKIRRKFLFMIPDRLYTQLLYEKKLGQKLELKNPKTFNEKIQWLKLNDRKAIYPDLVDKYAVKDIVARMIGEKYIIPTLGVWDSFDQIDFSQLPEQFVLKCTHDSGGLVICPDKSKLDRKEAKIKIEKSLKRNYYWSKREWVYKNIKPRIIAEKYMVDESGVELKDYKFFTFSGEVKCIQVDFDRFTDHHRNFYDAEWNYLPFTTRYPTNPDRKIEKPVCLDQLVQLAEKLTGLAENPAFLRVDFYVNGKEIYFGELTFYHGAGFEKFYPAEWGTTLGNWITLPIKSL